MPAIVAAIIAQMQEKAVIFAFFVVVVYFSFFRFVVISAQLQRNITTTGHCQLQLLNATSTAWTCLHMIVSVCVCVCKKLLLQPSSRVASV